MTTADRNTAITQGVEEIPLERADQLQPGVLVSGASAQYIWQVLDAERQREEISEGWIRLRQLTRGVRAHSHQWATRGESGVDCTVCGLRRQRIVDLLPVATPRAILVIPPVGVVNNVLAQSTLYATSSGHIVTVVGQGRSRAWSHALPLIPYLRPIWTLPCALDDLIKARTRIEDGGTTTLPFGGATVIRT